MSEVDNAYIRARRDPWRVRCPEGHTNIFRRPGGKWDCATCGVSHDWVVDSKTDRVLKNTRSPHPSTRRDYL